jgi:hypothetical protein
MLWVLGAQVGAGSSEEWTLWVRRVNLGEGARNLQGVRRTAINERDLGFSESRSFGSFARP